jgi:hypothetical protein
MAVRAGSLPWPAALFITLRAYLLDTCRLTHTGDRFLPLPDTQAQCHGSQPISVDSYPRSYFSSKLLSFALIRQRQMSATTHRSTPTLHCCEPRGHRVRTVEYARRNAGPALALIARDNLDAAGRLVAQWDARLRANGQSANS